MAASRKKTGTSRRDEELMRLALAQALRGLGRTSPNPLVGALLLKNGKIISRGYHRRAGAAHAEVVAIRAAGPKARGATLYSTLEPCDHYGRTPPCTEAIIRAGIKRVLYASDDPDPRVNGKGRSRLRDSGIGVVSGILKSEADAINRPYLKFMRTGLPWVSLKAAVTLDGKLATASGESKWITGNAARREVHELRNRVDAILVGRNTVLQDDPQLTVRLKGRRSKSLLRVVLDSALSLSPECRVFQASEGARTIVATAGQVDPERAAPFRSRGTEIWSIGAKEGRVDLRTLLRRLGEAGCLHVLVEGGAGVFASMVADRLADELFLFIAPKLLGLPALSWLGPIGLDTLEKAIVIKNLEAKMIGPDALVHGLF